MNTLPIETPVLAILVFLAAIGTAYLALRFLPKASTLIPDRHEHRHLSIDGLRGLLATGVFVHHLAVSSQFIANGRWETPPSQLYSHLGKTSVILFFMVTAFLFWGRLLDKRGVIDWIGFFNARIHRLYPVYLFAVFLVLTIVLISSGLQIREDAGSLATILLQWLAFTGASPPLPPDINGFKNTWMLMAGVTWSLRYEWLFYLALPFLGCLFARSGNYAVGALSLIAALAFVALYGGNEGINFKLLGCFLGGILAAYWVRNPRLTTISSGWQAGLLAITTLAATVAWVPANSPLTVAGLTLFFIVVASGHDFQGFLKAPAILLLGEISYSLYLLHGLVIWTVFTWLLPSVAGQHIEPSVFFLAAPVATIILVLLSTQASLCIERPGISLGKRHHRVLLKISNRFVPAR